MVDRSIPVRLSDDVLERLDRLAEELSVRAVGAKVSRAAATRVALERGLDSLESELGLTKAKKKH